MLWFEKAFFTDSKVKASQKRCEKQFKAVAKRHSGSVLKLIIAMLIFWPSRSLLKFISQNIHIRSLLTAPVLRCQHCTLDCKTRPMNNLHKKYRDRYHCCEFSFCSTGAGGSRFFSLSCQNGS